jgi:hypothetical protein
LLDHFTQAAVIHILTHAGARICHDMPVADIHQQAFDIGPIAAHTGFNRVNAAVVFEKNAVTIRPLCEYGALAGKSAVLSKALCFRDTQITRNGKDLGGAHIGTTVALAAFTALNAGEWLAI